MTISFIGSKTATKAGAVSGNTTIALNSGLTGVRSSVQVGDLVIAVFVSASIADRTLLITDGTNPYTLIGSELYANNIRDTNLRVAYKFMGGSPDTSTTFGPTGATDDDGAMAIYVFSGVNPTTPLDVAAVIATGTGRWPNPPSIVPSASDAVIVVVGGGSAGVGAAFTSSDLTSFATALSTTGARKATVGVGYITLVGFNSFDAAQFGGGIGDPDDSWGAVSIALRPGPHSLVASAGVYSTDVEGAILGSVSNTRNQFTVLRRPGDPLYEQIIIWSPFDLIYTTDPDHFERLEYIGIAVVETLSSHIFRVHFRDLTTFVASLPSGSFATTNGSAVVRVTHTAHGRRTGEFVRFSGIGFVGGSGIEINASSGYEYPITYLSDNTYNITQRKSVVMVGGSFATTAGSAVVRVTHGAHGRFTGNSVFFSEVDYVGGIKINGDYIMTVINANTYDITHHSAATSTATGGGTSITVSYLIPATATVAASGQAGTATYNEFRLILDATYSYAQAEELALRVAPRLGKLPRLFRQHINRVFVHPGSTSFSAGEAQFTLSEGRIGIRIAYNDLEESCFHEAVHAAIDEHYQGKGIAYNDHPGWEAAVASDNAFVDDYAASDDGEDFAQSGLISYAMTTHPERFSEVDRTLIMNQVPNRIAFFKNTVWVDPITACVRVPAASVASSLPVRFIDSIVNNVALPSHCRVLANLKVEAYYSQPDLTSAGIPDLYKFYCDVCGRAHSRTCIGNEPRAVWEFR